MATKKTEVEVSEGAGSQFTSLIQLDEVAVTTGTEDEEEIFKMRSKLFAFVSEDVYGGERRTNFWKERGTGDVKLLKHKTTGKQRLLMRQEKTLKIAANHQVDPDCELTPNVGSDRSWVFKAWDFADGEELKHETFAIRFANAENATKFKDAMEAAKAANAAGVSSAAGGGDDAAAAAPEAAAASDAAEKAALDAVIAARNKKDSGRRKSIQAEKALDDSDYDSDEEDVDETAAKKPEGATGIALAADLAKVKITGDAAKADA